MRDDGSFESMYAGGRFVEVEVDGISSFWLELASCRFSSAADGRVEVEGGGGTYAGRLSSISSREDEARGRDVGSDLRWAIRDGFSRVESLLDEVAGTTEAEEESTRGMLRASR